MGGGGARERDGDKTTTSLRKQTIEMNLNPPPRVQSEHVAAGRRGREANQSYGSDGGEGGRKRPLFTILLAATNSFIHKRTLLPPPQPPVPPPAVPLALRPAAYLMCVICRNSKAINSSRVWLVDALVFVCVCVCVCVCARCIAD